MIWQDHNRKGLLRLDKKLLRINRMTELLQQRRSSTVRELAGELKVSEMTVRRDLEVLMDGDIVTVAHGHVLLKNPQARPVIGPDYEWAYENSSHFEEKERIARFAASMIEPGDMVILDVGSTLERLPRHIPADMDFSAMCFSVSVFNQLRQRPNRRLILGGGSYHHATDMCESPENVAMVNNLRANKVFLSAGGVHRELGVTCTYQYEVDLKLAAISSSKTRILVTDSSKFGNVRVAFYAHLSQFDAIVTDTGLPEDWRAWIGEAGIKLHLL